MSRQEKQYVMCLPVCEQNSVSMLLSPFFFLFWFQWMGECLLKHDCLVFFLLDSRTHLCNDHVLSGGQGRHLLCIDTIPNLSAPPPKDTGEISFMLIHVTSPQPPLYYKLCIMLPFWRFCESPHFTEGGRKEKVSTWTGTGKKRPCL